MTNSFVLKDTKVVFDFASMHAIATYYYKEKRICEIVINNGGETAFYAVQIYAKLGLQAHCEVVNMAFQQKAKWEKQPYPTM